MLVRTSLALLITLAACSDSSSSTVDAAPPIDASPPTAMMVTCPATPAASISTSDTNDLSFMPSSVSITVGQIVKFTMSLTHSVEADTTMSDPGLAVAKGATKCLMFTKAGTFGFHCNPHGFRGSVIVQ
jgi:plastocyanin